MEGSLLAKLHILRCLEIADSIAGPVEVSQTFYNRYHTYDATYSVVSHLGVRCNVVCHTFAAVVVCCISY